MLIRGIEPNMRWQQFAHEILGVCHELGVEMVVTLGALLADSPHTRPVPVTGTSSDEGLTRSLHLEPSRYEGPTGIVGVLQDACTRAGVPALSFWAAVPHYVAQPPCPKATLALLRHIEDLLDVPDPARRPARGRPGLGARGRRAGRGGRRGRRLRPLARGGQGHSPTLPEASGDAIAREFERYLRRRGDDPPRG